MWGDLSLQTSWNPFKYSDHITPKTWPPWKSKFILLNDDTWGWWNWHYSEFCFVPTLQKAIEPERGVFWWTSVALRFVASLNSDMNSYLSGIHEQLGLQLSNVRNAISIGVHIRRGDKGNVAKPFLTQEYFEAMLLFVRDLSQQRARYGLQEYTKNLLVKVFLATDDPTAVEEARKLDLKRMYSRIASDSNHLFELVTAEVLRTNDDTAGILREEEIKRGGGEAILKRQQKKRKPRNNLVGELAQPSTAVNKDTQYQSLADSIMVDLYTLSYCDFFVGTYSSNIGRWVGEWYFADYALPALDKEVIGRPRPSNFRDRIRYIDKSCSNITEGIWGANRFMGLTRGSAKAADQRIYCNTRNMPPAKCSKQCGGEGLGACLATEVCYCYDPQAFGPECKSTIKTS
eukprot:TRINITY_DN3473_c0_g2_i1.p1 TRINITY_DN3473_c0_g2~~TRINITY_DN3473_c0_g2_i1.p1  ORF type:complete len:402 (-),score=43.33 TRINITY_DN3473_c0_g2_i1:2-1207(-)